MNAHDRLVDICLGPARSKCIYMCARLGIPELLESGQTSTIELAKAVSVKPEVLYRLLRALVSISVLVETAPGVFALSDLGQLLLEKAPNGLKNFVLQMNEEFFSAWDHAWYSLNTGQSAFQHVHGLEYFDWLATNPSKEVMAHYAMNENPLAVNAEVASRYDFSSAKVVCDIGGGAGALLSAILTRHSHLDGILFDLQSGLDVALSGTGGPLPRCTFVAGNFFENVPDHADIYLLKLVIHDWCDERALKILQACRNSMSSQARLLIIESLRPVWPKSSQIDLWDFHMLVTTGGRERSASELKELAEKAGLRQHAQISLNDFFYLTEFTRT